MFIQIILISFDDSLSWIINCLLMFSRFIILIKEKLVAHHEEMQTELCIFVYLRGIDMCTFLPVFGKLHIRSNANNIRSITIY